MYAKYSIGERRTGLHDLGGKISWMLRSRTNDLDMREENEFTGLTSCHWRRTDEQDYIREELMNRIPRETDGCTE